MYRSYVAVGIVLTVDILTHEEGVATTATAVLLLLYWEGHRHQNRRYNTFYIRIGRRFTIYVRTGRCFICLKKIKQKTTDNASGSSKKSSKLMFASCVSYFDRASYLVVHTNIRGTAEYIQLLLPSVGVFFLFFVLLFFSIPFIMFALLFLSPS